MQSRAYSLPNDEAYRLRIVDPKPGHDERNEKIETIKAYAMELAAEYFSDFALPSVPTLLVVGTRGFEDPHKSLSQAVGTITFLVRFSSLNNQHIELEVPFPVSRGQIFSPSIAIIAGKKYILSQGMIDDLIAKHQTMRPKIINPYSQTVHCEHNQVLERPMFSAPNDPSGWSDLISERYI